MGMNRRRFPFQMLSSNLQHWYASYIHLLLRLPQVMGHLLVEPDSWSVAAEFTEFDGCCCGHGLAVGEDVIK